MKNEKMQRANTIAINGKVGEMVATFKLTHKIVGTLAQQDTEFKTSDEVKASEARESFRIYAIKHAEEIGVIYQPQGKQAWDKKYNKYFTDEEISEDAEMLLTIGIDKIFDKIQKMIPSAEFNGVKFYDITPSKSNLAYVTDGKYTKDGSWACATISMVVNMNIDDATGNTEELDIPVNMAMVSGQIKKFHMTATNMVAMIRDEAELNGIVIAGDEDEEEEA